MSRFKRMDELPSLFEKNPGPNEELQRAIIYSLTPVNSLIYKEPVVYEENPHAEGLLKKLGLIKKPIKSSGKQETAVEEEQKEMHEDKASKPVNTLRLPFYDGEEIIFSSAIRIGYGIGKFESLGIVQKKPIKDLIRIAESYGANFVVRGRSKELYLMLKTSNKSILAEAREYTIESLKSKLEDTIVIGI